MDLPATTTAINDEFRPPGRVIVLRHKVDLDSGVARIAGRGQEMGNSVEAAANESV